MVSLSGSLFLDITSQSPGGCKWKTFDVVTLSLPEYAFEFVLCYRTGKGFLSLPADKRSSELNSVSFTDDGHNEMQIVETDYEKYIILHAKNSNDGETFQLMEFYGRVFFCSRSFSAGEKGEKRIPTSKMVSPVLSRTMPLPPKRDARLR